MIDPDGPGGKQRMSAQIKKVVVQSDVGDVEQFAPELGEFVLRWRAADGDRPRRGAVCLM